MANSTIYIDARKSHREKILAIIGVILAFLFLVYLCARAALYMQQNPETGAFFAVLNVILGFGNDPWALSFSTPFPQTLFVMTVISLFLAWCIYDHNIANRHYKDGEQYGTAKFMTVEMIRAFNMKFNAPYGKKYAEGPENTILSKHCWLGTNTRKTQMNNNVFVTGGPGSGKSFRIVLPNLLQADLTKSYVVTDPSGELMEKTGHYFEELGYDIKCFNLVDMAHSHRYNPLAYIRKEEDILSLIESFINNTDGGQKSSDPFWPKAERALLEALIFYVRRVSGGKMNEMQTMSYLSYLVRTAKSNDSAVDCQTNLDKMFNDFRKQYPYDICVKQYDIFKLANDKTATSILISVATRLDPFNIDALANLTSADDLDLIHLGDKPTILYLIMPQGNTTYNFIVNMLYTQMWDTLYYHALHDNGDVKLPCDIIFILDEFANIGVIPAFQEKLTTMRKYGMSCMIFIQALGQIKNNYKDNWETLQGACDTQVYLGGNETSSMKDLSEKLGEMTIRVRDRSSSRSGSKGTDSKSFKYTRRKMLGVDEIRRLKPGWGLIIIKGQQPFYDELYNPFEHPNARYLGNTDTKENCYKFDFFNGDPGPQEDRDLQNDIQMKEAFLASSKEKRPENMAIKKSTSIRGSSAIYASSFGSPELQAQIGGTRSVKAIFFKKDTRDTCDADACSSARTAYEKGISLCDVEAGEQALNAISNL